MCAEPAGSVGSIGRSARRGGFTLLEFVLATSLLGTALVVFGSVSLQLSRALSAVASLSQIVTRAPATMDRLVAELSNGRLLAPANPAGSTWIRFDKVIDVVDGAPVYGSPIQVELVPMESSMTDNTDNDGDGVIDEGGIRIWTDLAPEGSSPGAEDEQVVITGNVAKDGLQFTRAGTTMLVDLTFEDVVERGEAPTSFRIGSAVLMQ